MKKVLLTVATLATVVCVASFSNTPQPVKLNPAQRLYASIMTYAQQYEIPLHIAFNVARIETGYKGPFHDGYNHKQTSSAGALGPMQIMPQYASHYAGFKVSKAVLLDSIELNVEISMKMLNEWYKRYKRWDKATGAYNTGKPIINKYAKKAVIEDFYLNRWIRPDSLPAVFDLNPVKDSVEIDTTILGSNK
jgi:soluble lytic murein transglycosylase-like protein